MMYMYAAHCFKMRCLHSDKRVVAMEIYAVKRREESERFRADLDNKRLLLHSSAPENYLGILSS